jgi:predicted amidophosphoribosyltransferase
VLCVGANIFWKHPTRPCPRCGNAVRLDARACRRCRYRFAAV